MDFDSLRTQAWAELDRLQRQLLGPAGARPVFDSMGRAVNGGLSRAQSYWDQTTSRVDRVRSALQQSGPVAQGLIATRLAGIDFSMVWHILVAACKDIALYYGGSVVTGTVVGGVAGFFAGGVGAAPGAVAGAAAGSQVGLWVLAFLGLKSLAEYLVDAIPQAMRHYEEGFRRAWGDPPQGNRGRASVASAPIDVNHAAIEFGTGHVVMITAMLMALVAYLTRGQGNKARILQEIRQSPRLGPRVAAWVEAHESKLLGHPALNPQVRRAKPGTRVAGQAEPQTPSQLKPKPAPAPAPKLAPAPAPAIRNATNAEKGVFGEAKADQHMINGGFDKMNGPPVKVGDAPKGHGIDGVWRNKNFPPPPEYVIAEAKYGSSRLGTLKDGTRQMSDDWIDDRLNAAVGRREADRIRDAMARGDVEKQLLRVDENGTVTKTILGD